MQISLIKEKSFYKQVLAIMLPIALQQAINVGVNMMDTVMLGSFGETIISASSLANQFYHIFTIICLGITGGATVLSAQYWGSGDLERTRKSMSIGIQFSFIISVIFAVATFCFTEQIMRIYSNEADVVAEGVKYLKITSFIYILHGTSSVGHMMMRSIGHPKLGLYVSIVSFFVNVFANYVFIFGKLGAPRMEIAGAALGTLIARIVEFIITFVFIFIKEKKLCLRPKHLLEQPEKETVSTYFRLGAPVLVSDSLLGIGGTMVSVVLGHMGAAVVASNAICMVIDRVLLTVNHGVGMSSAIIVGNTVGKGDTELAERQGGTFYLISLVVGGLAAILTLIIGPLSIRLYSLEPETIVIAKQMMNAYAFIVFFQAVQMVMTKGVLRGGGDTQFLMKADILFMWLVSIPLGAVGGLVLHWPAWLTMICLRIDFAIKAVWCFSRLKSGKWIHKADGIG